MMYAGKQGSFDPKKGPGWAKKLVKTGQNTVLCFFFNNWVIVKNSGENMYKIYELGNLERGLRVEGADMRYETKA